MNLSNNSYLPSSIILLRFNLIDHMKCSDAFMDGLYGTIDITQIFELM